VPREAYLAARRAVTLEDLADAAVLVDATFRIRDGGAFWQVVDVHDDAVLTVDVARHVDDGRLVSPLTGATASTDGVWLVEATVPWAASADAGVSVVRLLAITLDATLVLRDGR
jgi:putative intracellular protease/amidase